MIERWNHDEREHREQFAGESFVAIDPGVEGYAMGFERGTFAPVGYCSALHPESLVALCRKVRTEVVIVEQQFIKSLAQGVSTLDLSLRCGMALGWLACALTQGGGGLNLFTVSPSTWQAHQRRRKGIPRQLERGEGIALAVERAVEVIGDQEEWQRATKKRREGMASALGIGEWWRSL